MNSRTLIEVFGHIVFSFTRCVQVQWISSISGILSCAFVYMWFFVTVVLLFRPFQLIWVKRKLVLATFLLYGLDTLYRDALQALQMNQSKAFTKQKIPPQLLFLMSICGQVYLLMKHFLSGRSSRHWAQLFLSTQPTKNKTSNR